MKKFLLGAAALAILIGGCDAASHIPALQPPSVPPSKPVTLPPVTEVPCAPGSSQKCTSTGQIAGFQRGMDIDWYAWSGQQVFTDAAYTMHYVSATLHANAVGISFPFFLNGEDPSSVHATSATPTPAELSEVVQLARADGLRVTLRPLLDERSLGISRVNWVPSSSSAFFRAYLRFLRPYAEMAQREHVAEFIVGAELVKMSHDAGWRHLDKVVADHFKGQLACADNWGSVSADACGTATQTVDAYPPLHGSLLAAWKRWDRTQEPGITETEVGIAATAQARTRPYRTRWHGTSISTAAQARWFAAACRAAVSTHLGGIYFWSLGLSSSPPAVPATSDQTAIGGAGVRAIASCYKEIAK